MACVRAQIIRQTAALLRLAAEKHSMSASTAALACVKLRHFSKAAASDVGKAQIIGATKGALAVEPVKGSLKPPKPQPDDKCGPVEEDDELADMVQMVDPVSKEWGGPTRGGSMPEPTRFGDWERKGRCTDFT